MSIIHPYIHVCVFSSLNVIQCSIVVKKNSSNRVKNVFRLIVVWAKFILIIKHNTHTLSVNDAGITTTNPTRNPNNN